MTTRRQFFQLIAGAALTPVLARAGTIHPVLWGDGIHDDAPALNALFRGDVVEFATPDIEARTIIDDISVHLKGAFRMESPLKISRPIHLVGGEFDHYHTGPLIDVDEKLTGKVCVGQQAHKSKGETPCYLAYCFGGKVE